MTIYCGHWRTTEVEQEVAADGRTKCLECEGTGDWTQFHPEPELGPFPCVVCKGTGFIYVSV